VSENLCDACGEAPAVIHLKEIENKKVEHLHLCQRCAEKRGYSVAAADGGTIQDLAEKLVTMAKDVTGRKEAEGIRCPTCGLFYSEFSKTGRLGCPDCYEAFGGQLKPILRKVHGSVKHAGRRPGENPSLREDRRQLRQLRAELDRAVRREDYESAAQLRDRIGVIERTVQDRTTEESGG